MPRFERLSLRVSENGDRSSETLEPIVFAEISAEPLKALAEKPRWKKMRELYFLSRSVCIRDFFVKRHNDYSD
jgi:hypothetical protein